MRIVNGLQDTTFYPADPAVDWTSLEQEEGEAICQVAALYGVPSDYAAAWVQDRVARLVASGWTDAAIEQEMAPTAGLGQQISCAWSFDRAQQRAATDPQWAADQAQMRRQNEAQTRQMVDAMVAAEAAVAAVAYGAAVAAVAEAARQAADLDAIGAVPQVAWAAQEPFEPAPAARASEYSPDSIAAPFLDWVVAPDEAFGNGALATPASLAVPAAVPSAFQSEPSAVATSRVAAPSAPEPPTSAVIPSPAPLASGLAASAAATQSSAWTAQTSSIGLVYEPAIDTAWLERRELALRAVRADYEAALAPVEADVFSPYTSFVMDEAGTRYVFDEARFVDDYRARAGAPLQALAAVYDTDWPTLLAKHPDVWALCRVDHALNAGTSPAGQAMGDAEQLAFLDLYLTHTQVAALITAYGGNPGPATSAAAQEQVRLYGPGRFAQLSRLSAAMQAVRDHYNQALADARAKGGHGWVAHQNGTYDEYGEPTPPQSVFDPDVFTAWYERQPGLSNETFKQIYGASHTQTERDESTGTVSVTTDFANPNWRLVDDAVTSNTWILIDPGNEPDFIDPLATGFDLEAGWITSLGNVHHHEDKDWVKTVLIIAAVALVSYASGELLGPWVGNALGVGSTIGAGIAGGAGGSIASGVINGDLSFKGVLTAALAGGLSAGLMQVLEPYILSAGSAAPALTIAARGGVQGVVRALLGGRFEEGLASGIATELANFVGGELNVQIDLSGMDAVAAAGARIAAKVFTSALHVIGSPDNPQYAFASALVGSITESAFKPTPTYQGAGTSQSPLVQPDTGDHIVFGAPAPVQTIAYTLPSADTAGFVDRPDGGNWVPGVQVASNDDGVALNNFPSPTSSTGFTRNNGEYADGRPSSTVGALGADAAAPSVPDALLPVGVTPNQVRAVTDEAGSRWYLINGLAYAPRLFTDGAQRIVDQGLQGLESGAVTPSQYLQAVRYVNGNDPAATADSQQLPAVILPWVVVTDKQEAIARDQVLQTELRQQGISTLDPDRFRGPLTQTQATLLTQTGYLFNDNEAVRLAQLRDQGQLLSLPSASSLAVPLVFGSLGEVAGELYGAGAAGRVLVASAEMIGELVLVVAETPLAALTLLLMPRNVGQSNTVYLNDEQRFNARPGERLGNLEERDPDGNWQVSKSNASLVSLGSQRVVAVTDDELRQLIRPLTTPGTPLPPGGPLVTPATSQGQFDYLPGYAADAPQMPTTELYPAAPPMSWDDLITERSNSKKLGQALRAAGIRPPLDAGGNEIPGYEAHHIVPSTAGGPRMADLRAKLQAWGIDLDGADNGVWLPGSKSPNDAPGAYHPRLNNDTYNEAVLKAFENVNDGITAMKSLAGIAEDLRISTFKGIRPRHEGN